jgi:hypothetical protein
MQQRQRHARQDEIQRVGGGHPSMLPDFSGAGVAREKLVDTCVPMEDVLGKGDRGNPDDDPVARGADGARPASVRSPVQ